MSIGFWVSVGWPLTSPGFDDMPGSFLASVVEGLAGRATLPDAPGSCDGETVAVEPLSVPEVVGLLGAVYAPEAEAVRPASSRQLPGYQLPVW